MKRLTAVLLVASSSFALAKPYIAKQRVPEEPSETSARLADAMRSHDAKAVAKLLHKNVLVRGMWFPDAGCTRQFGKEQTITKAKHAAFAQCLAKLTLQPSTRKFARAGSQVLTYAPGMELELGFDDGQLYYVGYLHDTAQRTIPTLTVQAFESLRKTGNTNVDKLVAAKLDGEVSKRGYQVAAWLDVCLDAKGTVKATVTEATTPEIGAVFLAATSDWTFDAFVSGKTAMPVCSQSLLTYPAAKAPKIELLPQWEVPSVWIVDGEGVEGGEVGGVIGDEWTPGIGFGNAPPPPPPPPPAPPQNVPPTLLEVNRTSGSKLVAPDAKTVAEIEKAGKDKVIGSFKLCVKETGTVWSVSQLKSTGFAAYDQKIEREMRTWTYKPYQINGKAAPVCTAVTFIYSKH